MQVDGISPGNAYGLQKVTGKENAPEGPSGQQPLSAEVADVSGDEPTGEEKKGVTRLLLEGHFKSVSDVRLRINFNDELTAIEAEELKTVAEQKTDGLLDSVEAGLWPLPTYSTPTSDETEGETEKVSKLQDTFAQAVNEAKERFLATDAPSKDELIADLRDAFATFLELLQALVPPPLVESGPDWQEFIDNLKSSFSGAMVELTTAVSAANVLPPLSEPNGNGVAYDKFLAIYNEMRGIVPDTLNSAV